MQKFRSSDKKSLIIVACASLNLWYICHHFKQSYFKAASTYSFVVS